MHRLGRRRSLIGVACAALAAGVAAALVLVLTSSSRAEPTSSSYRARVAAVCRAFGPRLDRIRPPDVAEPANVIDAVTRALPLLEEQQRRVRAIEPPPALQRGVERWLARLDRRLDLLDRALDAGRRQDFRTMSVDYVDFILAAPGTARLGSAIGIPHPPC